VLTQQQLELRKTYLGASEVASVLGVNPFASPWKVWALKRGLVPPDPGNEATESGNDFEPVILDRFERDYEPVRRGTFYRLPALHLGANLDAETVRGGIPVEAKTTGIHGPRYGEWGDDGTDHVPDCYIVQCHAQMMCTGKDLCHLFALLGGLGYRHYVIRRVDALCNKIAYEAKRFWEQCVIGGAEPDDCKPDLEILRRIRRQPGRVAKIEPSLVADYQAACAALKEAKARQEAALAAVIGADPEAEAFDYGDPAKWLTFYSYQRKGYSVDATTYRQLKDAKKPVDQCN
jgi:putative phage-type endonuclease